MLQLEALHQNGKLNSNELLLRIINLWVSKHRESASLQMLIEDLNNSDFQNVAGKTKYIVIGSRTFGPLEDFSKMRNYQHTQYFKLSNSSRTGINIWQ